MTRLNWVQLFLIIFLLLLLGDAAGWWKAGHIDELPLYPYSDVKPEPK